MAEAPKIHRFSARRLGWLLALPKLGIALMLLAVVSLFWILHRNEVEEERTALIKDVLWLEQDLRFHLTSIEEQMQQLALDLGQQPDNRKLFQLRINNLLRNDPELRQVMWLDAHRNVVDALPSAQPPDQEIEAFGPSATQKAYDMAARLGRRTYSEPFTSNGTAYFEVLVPVYSDRRLNGMLVGVYPMDTLLNHLVPWWFTEKYQVFIVDDNDIEYAAKSKIQGTPNQTYDIPFEPPGYGLKLRVTSYQTGSNPLQRFLAGAIVVLGAGIFWSLLAVRELMRKHSRAEEALRSEHAFRKAMEDSLTVGMRARDLTGRIIYVNPAFCRITGFSSDELVGRRPPMPYWLPDHIEETYAMHRVVMAGEAPVDGYEITFMRKSGELFHALIYEAPLIDGNGQHTGWMGSVVDVTERKRAEELARQQQEQLQFTSRLVTMGEMASTLAHELNQPLAAIASYNTGCLNLLETDNFDARDIRQALEKLGVQAQRAGLIIRRVHDFVRKSEPKRAPCRVEDAIEDCLGFVEAEARKRQIRLERDIETLPATLADQLMLEQVFLNLIRNGMEAMTDTPAEHRQLGVSARRQDGEIIVRVSDNGSGMSEEVRKRLFTAFFTTKPEGMGIGLSICRSIIEFHRGRLWAEDNAASPTGTGTVFIFTLPIEEPA
ncbi:MAG TPA: PAS domain S-box protein [Rhodocyclaceae bacterium]|nr:PAS domain S-box protein [Rhodocyclaceae bacterium]